MYHEAVKDEIYKYINKYENKTIGKVITHSLIGGKCIRAYIVKHVMNTLSDNKKNYWQPIASVEVLHSASLIIDDLPCMDNSLIRRKKNSTFVEFGERQAILTALFMCSDSLKILMDAFKDIKNSVENYQIELIYKLVTEWNELIGNNLVVGQMLDLQEDVKKLLNLNVDTDEQIIMIYKTSSIFILSFILGAIYSCKKDLDYEKFKTMGLNFGILFQIMDDFCDLEEDEKNNNTNFVSSNGFVNSLDLYINKKRELLILLKENNLFTKEMIQLINKLDKKIILKMKSLLATNTTTNTNTNTTTNTATKLSYKNKQYCISLLKIIAKT